MPLILLGLFTPRLAMFILWIATDYLSRAFGSGLWPSLGFFFAPYTTLSYAIATVSLDGIRGWGLALLIFGIWMDLGATGSAGYSRRSR